MVAIRVKGLFTRGDNRAGATRVVDGGEIEPQQDWAPVQEGVREVRQYRVRPRKSERPRGERDHLSGGLLWLAGLVIAASLVGAAYVSYEAQRHFAFDHTSGTPEQREQRAAIIAALPDAGWIAMAAIALVAALRGRSSLRARFGVLVFFGLSLGAQLLEAPDRIEGYLVAVIAPITLAWMLETFVVEVRRWAASRRPELQLEETPILSAVGRGLAGVVVGLVRLPLWAARLCVDWKGTWSGLRDWVKDTAPLAPGRTAASLRAEQAIEQAGSAEQAAEQARALALAEAEEIKQRTEAAAAERLQEVTADHQRQTEALNARLSSMGNQLQELQQANERLRQDYEVLHQHTSAKARLIALYEGLRARGDERYGDRERIAEVARELYQAARLTSEGTARNYLYEHVSGSVGAANGAVA